jgi:hypothetical protein
LQGYKQHLEGFLDNAWVELELSKKLDNQKKATEKSTDLMKAGVTTNNINGYTTLTTIKGRTFSLTELPWATDTLAIKANSEEKEEEKEESRPIISFGLAFESTLKYVQLPVFPQLKFTKQPPATLIFEWLSRCKGVEHILEIRVDDGEFSRHSEEDIEASLTRFDVRDLDWRRVDLSIDSVMRAAPNVERLHLYSSGNLGTIDHWLGRYGIQRLSNV